MSHLIVCAVFDRAAQAFMRPAYFQSQSLAVRSFENECRRNAPDNVMYTNPEDFEFYKLGIWDDEIGSFIEDKSIILRAQDVKRD